MEFHARQSAIINLIFKNNKFIKVNGYRYTNGRNHTW